MEVILPRLQDYQRDVLQYYIDHPHDKWGVVKSPRQCGKSIILAILLIYASLVEVKSWSLSISPIFAQARKIYTDVVNIAGPLIKKANNSQLEILFINGSAIKFGSAEQGDALRGYTTKHAGILCVDEGAFIKKDFFYDILVLITNVHHCDIFIFSTPKFKTGLFYELYTQGMSSEFERVHSFDWTEYDLSEYLPEHLLAMYRKQLPRLTFQSEYLAQFITGEGTVFPAFKQCVGTYTLDKNEELYLSVDWSSGTGADYTVITVGQPFGDAIAVHQQVYFNDKTPNTTVDYIANMVADFAVQGFKTVNIIVEKNSIGAVYYSMLVEKLDHIEVEWNENHNWNDQLEISCGTFTTTNISKKRAVERLELLFEQNRIIIPNDDKLLTELATFEAKVNNLGTVTYAASSNNHDDCVLSLLFLVDRLYSQKE